MKSLLLALIAASLAGCSSTHYKSTTYNDGVKTERELTATIFLVKRDIGKVVLGPDSLNGSHSDSMKVASDALALAAAALKP